MRPLVSRKPESQNSPMSGRMNHVRTKVNQYVILQVTNTALSGSQMPRLGPSLSAFSVDARSIGTRRMMEQGRARERKTGTSR